MHQRTLLALAAAAALAACTQGIRNGLLPASAPDAAAAGGGSLELRVALPRHRDSLSPATVAIAVRVTGPTKVHKEASLRVTERGCRSKLVTLTCQLELPNLKPCPSAKRCYSAAVATYDAFDEATGKIPPTAHELAAETKFPFSVAKGKTTIVPLALDGIPSSVAFLPGPSTTLTGSQNAGYVMPKCSATAQTIDVIAADADGNYLIGAGSPAIAITSANPAQLSVSTSPSNPNEFALNPPAAPNYAFGNHANALTLTATPGRSSGATALSSSVNVTYSGDICGVITEFPLPTAGAEPIGIAAGPDGNLWFTEFKSGQLGRITTSGEIQEFPLPSSTAEPYGITAGPDGNLWFAEHCSNAIAKASTAGVVLAQYPLGAGTAPAIIASGPGDLLWFGNLGSWQIGSVTTTGSVNEYPDPNSASVDGIAAGPDGNMWFTDVSPHVGFITSAGSATDWPLVSGVVPGTVAPGPNGDLWFTECVGNLVAEITTDGTIPARWTMPETASRPLGLAAGPDGAMWATELSGNRVARIATSGVISEYAVPTVSSGPGYVALGADGALWFTEVTGNKIARLY